jgi:hypothetical protein
MKLIIQIPCFNEAATLPIALAALPRQVIGFDLVEWLIIDDGTKRRRSPRCMGWITWFAIFRTRGSPAAS